MGLRTRAMLLLQLHAMNQILLVFAQTQRKYCAQFGRVFILKFLFTNRAPDFSIKKLCSSHVCINHGSLYVCRKLIYYVPRMYRTRAMQHSACMAQSCLAALK